MDIGKFVRKLILVNPSPLYLPLLGFDACGRVILWLLGLQRPQIKCVEANSPSRRTRRRVSGRGISCERVRPGK